MPSNDNETETQKSSMEILSELFSTFDAEPPVIVKKEKDPSKKHKKSKKKHKHKSKKEKKHKKKSKKRKRSCSSSSESSTKDLAEILIKTERECPEKKIKLENGIGCDNVKERVKKEKPTDDSIQEVNSDNDVHSKKSEEKDEKANVNDVPFVSLFESTILEIKEKQEKDNKDEQSYLSGSDKSEDELSEGEIKKKNKDKSTKKKHKHKKHEEDKHTKRSHRSTSKDKKRSRSRSKKRKSPRKEKSRSRSREHHHHHKEKHKENHKEDNKHKDHKIREWDEPKYRDKDYFKKLDRDLDEVRGRRYRDDSFYKSDDKEDKWFMRDRYRGYSDRDREKLIKDRSPSKERLNHIDKKKLLEIARKNAIQMMKSGSLPGALNLGPQAQEKVIAAIKSGGKTIEELTDFCKTLSKKEEMGDLSSVSEDNASESETDMPFHHPFQIKERPSSITMNIKNSIPLPLKSTQERVTELRMQFPVSSGQQHRKTESEWTPVSPKKPDPPPPVPVVAPPIPIPEPPTAPLAIEPAPVLPGPQVFPAQVNIQQSIDIASIVSQRLTAMRKLQENPHDVQAITQMYKAQKEMNTWAESKQQIGQFTGSTGAQILSQAELSSGYQVWARKDQLQTAAPVSGGMGMHLLQKMGWKPGEGLGKEKTGALEPLLLEVKLDKKGIVAKEEQKTKRVVKPQKPAVKAPIQGKHPVSLLGEYASKNKLGVPQYSICFECGPDHKKNFLFKVILNGVEYKPNIVSPNKKEAKANAASVCLQQLGILPTPPVQNA